MINHIIITRTLLVCALLVLSSVATAQVLVIGDPQLSNMDKGTLKRLYLGKENKVQGINIQLADLPGGSVTRDQFYQKLTNKKPQQIKAYWAKLVFSGRATPPMEFSDDDSVIQWVQGSSGRIGYVSRLPEKTDVKTLLIID